MKKIFLKLGLCGLIMTLSVMVVSCEKDSQHLYNYEESTDINYPEIISHIGLDASSAVDMGDYFVVEGDIMLSKEQLLQEKDLSTRQVRGDYTVSLTYRYDIKVGIDSNIPNQWYADIQQALDKWNATMSVNMRIVTTSNQDILIKRNDTLGGIAGALLPMSNGKPGSTVEINFNEFDDRSSSQKILIMVHELGHCLGLRHTNWRVDPYASGSYIGISGTPNTVNNPDPNSVMNWDAGGLYWNGFSYYDNIAIETIYGKPYLLGLLSGNQDPSVGVSTVYSIPFALGNNVRSEWVVEDGKGEPEGSIQYPSGQNNTVIFQKRGLFNIFCRFYLISNGQYIGGKSLDIYVDMF